MRESKETLPAASPDTSPEPEELEICEIIEAGLSPSERFRRRQVAVLRRCAKRPPKTQSGQSREQMRASRNASRRRRRSFPL